MLGNLDTIMYITDNNNPFRNHLIYGNGGLGYKPTPYNMVGGGYLEDIHNKILELEPIVKRTGKHKKELSELFKIKYGTLKRMKGGMIGGMTNIDKNNNIVEQIIDEDNEGNIIYKNIPSSVYIDTYDDLDDINKYEGALEQRNKEIDELLVTTYDAVKTMKKNLKGIEEQNIDIIEDKTNEEIELDKEFYNNALNENMRILENLYELKYKLNEKLNLENVPLVGKNEFFKDLKKDVGKNEENPIYKDIQQNVEKEIKERKKNKDYSLKESFEIGNQSEDKLIKNQIILQEYTGDFSDIKNSKDIKAYNEKFIKDLKEKLLSQIPTEKVDNVIVDKLLKFFPVDGISNNNLYELKAFFDKDVYCPNNFDEYNMTKLYGYDLRFNGKSDSGNKFSPILYEDDNIKIIFDGSIRYDFDYSKAKKEGNQQIDNILFSAYGNIKKINKNDNSVDIIDVNIKNTPTLNKSKYDYVWIDNNKTGINMFNPLNRKSGITENYIKREGLHGYETHYSKDDILMILKSLQKFDDTIDLTKINEENLKKINFGKIEQEMNKKLNTTKDKKTEIEINEKIDNAKNILLNSPLLKENMISETKKIIKRPYVMSSVLPKSQVKTHEKIMKENKSYKKNIKSFIKRK